MVIAIRGHESGSMKIILRWRWVLVVFLLLILYFMDQGHIHLPNDPQVWWYVILMLAVGYFGEQLKRIEDKLDATLNVMKGQIKELPSTEP